MSHLPTALGYRPFLCYSIACWRFGNCSQICQILWVDVTCLYCLPLCRISSLNTFGRDIFCGTGLVCSHPGPQAKSQLELRIFGMLVVDQQHPNPEMALGEICLFTTVYRWSCKQCLCGIKMYNNRDIVTHSLVIMQRVLNDNLLYDYECLCPFEVCVNAFTGWYGPLSGSLYGQMDWLARGNAASLSLLSTF